MQRLAIFQPENLQAGIVCRSHITVNVGNVAFLQKQIFWCRCETRCHPRIIRLIQSGLAGESGSLRVFQLSYALQRHVWSLSSRIDAFGSFKPESMHFEWEAREAWHQMTRWEVFCLERIRPEESKIFGVRKLYIHTAIFQKTEKRGHNIEGTVNRCEVVRRVTHGTIRLQIYPFKRSQHKSDCCRYCSLSNHRSYRKWNAHWTFY